MSGAGSLQVVDWGRKTYQESLELQKQLVASRAAGEIPDTLVFVEHDPVYTVGRAGGVSPSSALTTEVKVRKLGVVPIVEIERGGKMTFHGPGQIVGYPIFALPHRDLRRYLRDLERVLVSTLSEETLLPAQPCPETLVLEPGQLQTGVWVHDRKLASIGIAVKKWVSFHGFALNVSTDLRYFEAIEPCGFRGDVITSVAREMGADADMVSLTSNLKRALAARFATLSETYAPDVRKAGAVVGTLAFEQSRE